MPSSPEPRLAVIVVTWNSGAVIRGLLRSIQGTQAHAVVDVIVVDNASSDNTVAIVRELMPRASVVQTGRNAGFAAGANAGMLQAGRRDGYFVVNPDITLRPDTIQVLLATMQTTGAGIVVPRLVDEHGSLRWSLRREPTVLRAWGEAVLGGNRAGLHPRWGEVEKREAVYTFPATADWASGAAMLISGECAATVGAWDESYFLYSEETDFALRARDAGFPLRYAPTAVAEHLEGDSHVSAPLFALLSRNRVKLFRSRHSRIPSLAFWTGVFVGEALRWRRPVRRAAVWALLGRTKDVASSGT